ncbi:MAG: hypothetical protein ABW075_12205 [Aeromicrobium sp.]
MTSYTQTVRSRALAGRETEYLDWYVATHMPAVLDLDGFVSGELHRLVSDEDAPAEFLCIYRIETTDLAATQAAMLQAGAGMVPSEAMDVPATQIDFFVGVDA